MTMKNISLIACALFVFVSACKKADDGTDLTASITGHYTNSAQNTDIVVNKVDDTHISITLSTGSGSGSYSVAFPSATMTSANAFTLNTVTQNGASCIGEETYSGTGTHTGNNISLFMTIVGTGTGTPYDCTGTTTDNVSASK